MTIDVAADVTVTVRDFRRINTIQGADKILIAPTGELELDAASTYNGSIDIAGTLDLDAPLTVNGSVKWTAGIVDAGATLNIASGATMSIDGADAKALNGAAGVDVSGLVQHVGEGGINITSTTGGFMIQSNGVYDLQSDADLFGNGRIGNSGTFRKSAGTGESILTVNFDMTPAGRIDGQSGQITLADSGSKSTGGTIDVSDGAIVDLTGDASPVYSGMYSGSGGGRVQVQSGTLQANDMVIDFPEGMFHWSGGELRGNTVQTLTNIGFMQISGADDRLLRSLNIVNQNTIVQTDAQTIFHSPAGFADQITNEVGGLFDMQGELSITAALVINNLGTFRKSTSTNEAALLGPFNNQGGTIEVDSGQLTLSGGGTSTGGFFDVDAGAVLDLTGNNTPVYTGTYSGAGDGRVQLHLGVLQVNDMVIDFPEGLFHWSGGELRGNTVQTLTNIGFMQISGADDRLLRSLNIVNENTIVQSDAQTIFHSPGDLTDQITNEVGGLFDMQGELSITAALVINNLGTFRKSTSPNEVALLGPFNNLGGTIEVDSGQLTLGGGGTSTGGFFDVDAGAVLDLTGNNTPVYTGTYSGTGDGRVQLHLGVLQVNDMVIDFPEGLFHWSGGELRGNTEETLTNIGFMQISGADDRLLRSLNIVNQNTIVQTDAQTIFHSPAGLADQITNEVGGLFDMQGEMSTTAGLVINNQGTFRKSVSTNEAVLDGPFNNLGGTAEIVSGQLSLSGGGLLQDAHHQITAGAKFAVVFGNFVDFAGRTTGSGEGAFEVTGRIRGDADSPGILDFEEGTFQWVGAIGSSSSGTLINDGHITIAGVDPVSFRGVFTNRGTMRLEGSFFDLGQTSGFVNIGLFEFAGDGDFGLIDFGGIGSQFFNTGIIRKVAGTGVSDFEGLASAHYFSSTGTMEALTGTLRISVPVEQFDGATLTGGTWNAIGGTIDVPLASNVTTNQGHVTLSGPASVFTPINTLQINSGSFNLLDGRDFSTIGSLNNGGTRLDAEYEVFDTNQGPIMGIAFDAASGNLFLHPRSDSTIMEYPPTLSGVLSQIPRPGATTTLFDLDFISAALDVGGTVVPAGSLLVLNGQPTPPTLSVIDMDSGAVLASVMPAVPAGTIGIAYHPTRGTIFILERTNDEIHEVDPSDGSVLNSFTVRPSGEALFDLDFGDIEVDSSTGNLLVAGSTQSVIRELTPTGAFIRDWNVGVLGIQGITGLARDDATGDLWLSGDLGAVARLSSLVEDHFGEITVGVGSTLTVNGEFIEDSTETLNLVIGGSPGSGLFGQVISTDTAHLLGNLNIELAPGFSPSPGDSYTILTFPDRVGTFNAISGEEPFFNVDVQESAVVLNAQLGSGFDLAVDSITVPPTASPGVDVTISYVVRNLGGEAVSDDLTDSIFLSRDATLSADDLLVGRVLHVGGIALNGTYNESLTATLPGVVNGTYHIIVVSDSQLTLADMDRDNNVADSLTPITVTVPTLAFDTPVAGTIAAGQDVYFRLSIPAGADVRIDGSFAAAGLVDLAVGYGRMPTASVFDFTPQITGPGDTVVSIKNAIAGSYYIRLTGREGAGAGTPFQLLAEQLIFDLEQVTNLSGSNAGLVTTTLIGSGFTSAAEVSLRTGGGSTLVEADVTFVDDNTLYATFDLTGLPTGSYTFNLTDTAGSLNAASPFVITDGIGGEVTYDLIVPQFFRAGRPSTVIVQYANVGQTDVVAPIFNLDATNALFADPSNPFASQDDLFNSSSATISVFERSTDDFRSESVAFMGINPVGPAGILPPGASGFIRIDFNPTRTGQHVTSEFSLNAGQPSTAFLNWDGLEAGLRPEPIPVGAWSEIFDDVVDQMGATVFAFQKSLAANATHLGTIGQRTANLGELVSFEFQQVPLEEIAARYALGSFGFGQHASWDARLEEEFSGDVTIENGGRFQRFTLLSDGSYLSQPGDTSKLIKTGGTFELTGPDGSRTGFDNQGRWSFQFDRNDVGVAASYSGDLLTELVYTNGDVETFLHNAQGHITQMTDRFGRVSTFTYDASGTHLVETSNAQGTTTYTYITGQGAAREHAIESITFPQGTSVEFTYDHLGRTRTRSLNGGEATTTFTYDDVGTMTVTDAGGSSFSYGINLQGQIASIQGPLNSHSLDVVDSNGQIVRSIASGTLGNAASHDELGNLTRLVDAAGNGIELTYAPGTTFLTSVTNALGVKTEFDRDENGNLLEIRYADGTVETFEYDALGRVVRTTNARDQQTDFVYDNNDRLVAEDRSDGTDTAYTYDANGNLTAVTDPNGVTEYDYDADDRLVKITYPTGHFLEFEYDSLGRRAAMVDQDGFEVKYTYDSLGRLQSLADEVDQPIVTYTYDATSRLASQVRSNGTSTHYVYDELGRISQIVHRATDQSVQEQIDYTYDAFSRPVQVQTNAGLFQYGYDAAGQLDSVTTPGGRTIQYEYDAAGNRISVDDDGAATAYQTNLLDQYTTVGAASFTYDADGNLTSRTDASGTTTYTYDQRSQLTRIDSPTGVTEYVYDGLNRIVAVIEDGNRTDWIRDSEGRIVAAYDQNGLVSRYLHGVGLESQINPLGEHSFYGFDATGNTLLMTDPGGSVANTYAYLPFGEVLSRNESLDNRFTFVGQAGVLESVDGLYVMQQRFYDAALGRFLERDPVGVTAGDPNLYRYAFNSPVDNIDPNGLDAVPTFLGEGGTTGNLAVDIATYLPRAGLDHPALGALSSLLRAPVQQALGNFIAQKTGTGAVSWLATQAASQGALKANLYLAEFFAVYAISRYFLEDSVVDDFYQDLFHDNLWKDYYDPGNDDINYDRLKKFEIECFKMFGTVDLETCLKLIRKKRAEQLAAADPNEIYGPGDFIRADQLMPFVILFENVPDATAPAAEVFITQQLDSQLDFSSFELGDIGFGTFVVDVPEGLSNYEVRLDLTSTIGIYLDIDAGIDLTTGMVHWTFRSIDPTTGDLPADVFAGFLPPNVNSPEGEGFVSYTIHALPGLMSGDQITSQARIVFDVNDPIDTPIITSTVDEDLPTSSVDALPAVTNTESFSISWSGDDGTGSGIAFFDIYVSQDGGPFELFLEATTETSAVFEGQFGSIYAFYSVAIDNVALSEADPPMADTMTEVTPLIDPPTAGDDTFALFEPSLSSFFIKNSNTAGPADQVAQFGPAGSSWIPLAGDWNQNGADSLGFYDPASGQFYLKNEIGPGAADTVVQYGPIGAGWIPIVGDWDGDGRSTVGLYEPTNSVFFLSNTNMPGPADVVFQFGAAGAGWTPIVGDWDGDGTDTIGFYNGSSFFLQNSFAPGPADLAFGYGPLDAHWLPLAGDWNDDGMDTIALFAPDDGVFYFKHTNESGFADAAVPYGPPAASWIPLTGNWDGTTVTNTLLATTEAAKATEGLASLIHDALTHAVETGLDQLAAAGLDELALAKLTAIDFRIADLAGAQLGLYTPQAITLDDTAAGHGWHLDPTTPPPTDRIDLLSVVLHEMGHELGLPDLPSSNTSHLMQSELAPGKRLVASPDLIDEILAHL